MKIRNRRTIHVFENSILNTLNNREFLYGITGDKNKLTKQRIQCYSVYSGQMRLQPITLTWDLITFIAFELH